ncbi:MAG: condensation domain-containing protein, partial [Tumebacillaceae bacterium]
MFDQVYDTVVEDYTFNTIGWDSHYTGEPIPQEEMREWLNHTMDRILAVNPKRVLEIGCGSGMILFNLLPQVEHYTGTDISRGVLDTLTRYLSNQTEHRDKVQLLHMSAGQIKQWEADAFDLVVLNSVVQYFPSLDYLVDVIQSGLHKVGEQGTLFLGDIRSLPLLKTFHATVELFRSADHRTTEEWLKHVQRGVNYENELAIDPAFFYELQQRFPQIARVEVLQKRGRGRNELTQFRYDVLLHVGTPETATAPAYETLDWVHDAVSVADIRHALEAQQPQLLVVRNVPDARIFEASHALQLVAGLNPPRTVGEVKASLRTLPAGTALEPDDLYMWERELPYHVEIRPANASGRLQVIFRHHALEKAVQIPADSVNHPRTPYANNPLRAQLEINLVPLYRSLVSEKLPEYMVPSAFVLMEELPLNPNGKVDRKALPSPDKNRAASQAEYVAPRNETEQIVADVWKQLLGIEMIGIYDNFFELGGHSLLGTQVISRLRDRFQTELTVRTLFEAPTVEGLGQVLQANTSSTLHQASEIHPVARDGQLPLSFAQQRLWFMDQLEEDSALYNMPVVLRMTGQLDVSALEASVQELIARHEILRTTFAKQGGDMQQIIAPRLQLPLARFDVTNHVDREQEAKRLIQEEIERPFELQKGPLLRVSLLELTESSHLLIVNMHHIISDGWSLSVFTKDLAALYNAYAKGEHSPLEPLPLQYADFAVWQREWLEGGVLESQLDYWKQQLAGELPVSLLPTDRPRPAVQTYNGGNLKQVLNGAFVKDLYTVSQREGATLFMTLLAAFQTLMHRYSGHEDIVVGTPVANRNHSALENIIGFFVNMLVMRTD